MRPVGVVVLGLAIALAVCGAAGLILDVVRPLEGIAEFTAPRGGATALFIAAGISGALGIFLYARGRRHIAVAFTRREATLAVAMIWLAAGVCGAIPFVLGAGMSPVDAIFEAISGLTTTGATVITDIEGGLSRPILLWRSLIQWMGGMGIVVLFVAVFPNLGAGGKHMFRGEVPGTSAEGMTPRIAATSFSLWKLYAAFTLFEAVALTAAGMDPFEAVCHSFTTLSTGGFSTRDASVAAFDSPSIDMIIGTFMYIGAMNFGLFYGVLQTGSLRGFWRNVEFRAFVLIVVVANVVMTIGILPNHDGNVFQAFRYAYFTVATFLSSTGYGTDDYMAYPAIVLLVILALMFIGGCSGSTAGGIKVERIVLLIKRAKAQIRHNFAPNVIHVVRIGGRSVDRSVMDDVAAFFFVFLAVLALAVAGVVACDGTAIPTAFGAALSCISNMGPAPFYDGADNFAAYSPPAKIILTLTMLVGRLEFFTILALLVPGFWRR